MDTDNIAKWNINISFTPPAFLRWENSVENSTSEDLPGVSGNKETWSFISREQEIYVGLIWESKGTLNYEQWNLLIGSNEEKVKFLRDQENMLHPPPPTDTPSRVHGYTTLSFLYTVLCRSECLGVNASLEPQSRW